MKTEQLLELIRELFDVSEYDEDDRCIVLHSRRNGVLRFERFAQRVLEAAPAVECEPVGEIDRSDDEYFVELYLDNGFPQGFKTGAQVYLHPPNSPDTATRALAISICDHVLSHTHPWAYIDEARKLKEILGAE